MWGAQLIQNILSKVWFALSIICSSICYQVMFWFMPHLDMHNCQHHTWQLQNIPRITLSLRNTRQYSHLSYISFQIVPLCNCTLLPVSVKVLQTFLEAIFLKPFQLFLCICNDVSNITKSLSLQW
jgi:hypothetical protein